ncbi:MAG: prolyl oligopeptidase family serine peptidase [Actinomycetota bacterium]
MVGARAGRWLRRLLAIAIALAVVVLVAATWIYAGRVDGLLLRSAHGLPTYGIEVLAVADGEMTLPRGSGEALGTWGLEWETGYAQVGPVVATSEAGVVRPLLEVAGDLRPGLLVALDAYAFESDPSAVGVEFENVIVEGPLGNHPAWYTPGDDDTWVILVHDRDAYRREALRALPALAAAGFPTLTITYRNDPGAPDGGGRYGLGDPEWEDLEAAVEYAVEEGAVDVVLFGWGMGGTAAAMFLHESSQARLVAGLIFDAPLFDPGAVVDGDAHQHNVPGFIVGWAKGLATLRWGVDWGALNQVDRADDFEVPILLFHGDADASAPVAVSDRFAAALPDLVRYEKVPGAGHGASWNADPARYEAALTAFLEQVAAGPAGEPEQG